MNSDTPAITERLSALAEFINHYPLPQEVRERMTFRAFHSLVTNKKHELGLDEHTWAEARKNDDLVEYFNEIGMGLDERGLMAEDAFQDLPLNWHSMPAYAALDEAVERYWERWTQGMDVKAELAALVAQYAPKT